MRPPTVLVGRQTVAVWLQSGAEGIGREIQGGAVIESAIPRIRSSNALGYDTTTRCRLSRLHHLIKRFPHLVVS